MAWYRVVAQCEGPPTAESADVFYDLIDETTELLGVKVEDGSATAGRRSVELELAVDVENKDAAERQVQALLAARFRLPVDKVALGEATETTNPRALSAAAQDILRDAAEELREELREDLATLREGGSYEHSFAVQQHLPAGFARYYTPELVAQWAGSVESVAHKFAAYPDTYLATSAEELPATPSSSAARS